MYFCGVLTICLGHWYFRTQLSSLLLSILFVSFCKWQYDFTCFELNLFLRYSSRCIAFPVEENLCIGFPLIDLYLSLF